MRWKSLRAFQEDKKYMYRYEKAREREIK